MGFLDRFKRRGGGRRLLTQVGGLSPLFPPADLPDRSREAHNALSEAVAAFAVGKLEESLRHFQEALAMVRRVSHPKAEVRILYNIGVTYYALGRHEEALRSYQEALAIAREIADDLAREYRELIRQAEELRRVQPGLAVMGIPRHERELEIFLLQAMAKAYEADGRPGDAAARLEEAAHIAAEGP